jgi:hypothetical protein
VLGRFPVPFSFVGALEVIVMVLPMSCA